MATVTEPVLVELQPPAPAPLFRRPTHPKGLWSWMTTVDHNRIGILYGVSAFVFFLVGWFGYAPQTVRPFSSGHNIDFWVFGLQILGIASLTSAINLIITIINMRAPGMSMMRMPIFAWMTLVAQFLLLFAIPVITVALFLLMFDRVFGANSFNVQAGADPLLWQHLFWLLRHA